MKKQWKQLFWIVFSIFLLAACGIQSVEQHEKMEAEERSIEHAPVQQELADIEEAPVKEVVEEKPAETVVPQEEPKVAEPAKVEAKPEPKPEVKSEVKSEPKPQIKSEPTKPEPKAEVKAESKPEVKQEPVKQSTPEPKPVEKKRTVTIAIYVHSLVANMDKLHPSLQSEKYVPSSGVILKPVTYELLSEKDTVWDILKRATKEHGIQLEYEGADENIYDSVYIEGIHHLYEFSAGPLSGWMYKVNGTFPNYGASQYTLADGDVIEWHYTVDLGRDLGKDV